MIILKAVTVVLDFALIGICVLGVIADKMTKEESLALSILSIVLLMNIFYLIAEIRW